jgi:cyclic pyranopterin phosphate synthase
MTEHKLKPELSHLDDEGHVRMVNVSDKDTTLREAVARGRIRISDDALALILAGTISKGNPLEVARIAGILAAKRTADLIPLCHQVPLTHIEIDLQLMDDGYEIQASVKTTAQTGVEMEALTAVATTALTIYDMVKAVDRTMVIGEIRLIKKSGGNSGVFEQG